MTKQEDTRRKSRRDLLLILLILPFGVLCMFITGQAAIKLAPTWLLPTNMFSNLDPNADFAGLDIPQYIEPLDPGILTQQPNTFFSNPIVIVISTPAPVRTPQPPPAINTLDDIPPPTATPPGGVVILPTKDTPQLADLAITKTDSSSTYTPGTPINYTIVVKNNGPNPAPQFNINDNIPAVITGLTVNCTPALNCGVNTSSGNAVSFSNAALNAGEQLSIIVSGLVNSGATGNLSNTAELTIPPKSGYKDPISANNVVIDTDTRLAISDLAITKSDGNNTYTANSLITYTIVVTNSGPSDALGVRVVDNKPAQIASWTWTCSMTNATGCNGVSGSTTNFTDNGLNIRVGGRIEYIVTAYLPVNAYLDTSSIVNTARILLPGSPDFIDQNLSNNSFTDTDIPFIDLQIAKSDGGATFAPNGTVPYTVTVTNNSTFDLIGVTISDPMPALVTSWGWCVDPCTPDPNSSNTIFTDTINLTRAGAVGNSLTYNVMARISPSASFVDTITNTAGVTAPTGLVDADGSNNSATDTTPPYIDLQITKTDGASEYIQGGSLLYSVTVRNNSAFDLSGVTVTDNMPTMISSWSWTCLPDSTTPPVPSCSSGPSATNINDNTVTLPVGRSVIYTINATVSSTAMGNLTNRADVLPPNGLVDAVPGDNTAEDTNPRLFEYTVLGPPDGVIVGPVSGLWFDYTLAIPITIDGNMSDYEIVFYERDLGDNTIDLDQVIISISNDLTTWYTVYYWGDNLVDTNASPPGSTSEPDNYNMPSSLFYGSPYQTGILIDADGSTAYPRPPNGTYQYIRVTAPLGDADNGCDIDTIGVWP